MCEDCTRYRGERRQPREPRSGTAGAGELLYKAVRVEVEGTRPETIEATRGDEVSERCTVRVERVNEAWLGLCDDCMTFASFASENRAQAWAAHHASTTSTSPEHIGGNAESCPACLAADFGLRHLPYPWICPASEVLQSLRPS
jgi:hypothetical protein